MLCRAVQEIAATRARHGDATALAQLVNTLLASTDRFCDLRPIYNISENRTSSRFGAAKHFDCEQIFPPADAFDGCQQTVNVQLDLQI